MAKNLKSCDQGPKEALPHDFSTTLYHIYHSGPWTRSYSVHTRSDSATTLRDKFPSSSFKNRQISKYEALDNPRYDPRTETAPYYVHLPTILDHYPHFSLHRGGTKDAPIIAFLHQPLFSRKWKLELGGFPTQPGNRGRVRKEKDGTLTSSSISKRFRFGDSIGSCSDIGDGARGLGRREKKKSYEQLDDEFDELVEEEEYQNDRDRNLEGISVEEVLFLAATCRSLLPFPNWHNPILYQFSWRGWAFHWQRHVHSQSKRGMSLFVWLPSTTITPPEQSTRCHKAFQGRQNSPGEFMQLAMFGKRRIKRKVGRLELYDTKVEILSLMCLMMEAELRETGGTEDGIGSFRNETEGWWDSDGDSLADQEDWFDEKLAGLSDYSDRGRTVVDSGARAIREASKRTVRWRQQIHDIVVATAMCVIISERRIF